MSYPDDFRRTAGSIGSLQGSIPADMQGSTTTSYSALNNPQNTQTVGGSKGADVQYPHSRTNVSRSGHVLQFNDTPAGERVLLKHRSGSAVDMLPNGDMAISSNGNLVLTVMKDQSIVIHGSVKYEVNGDFDFDVRGNFNVNALNYNLNVEGNKLETIKGASRSIISGNQGTTVKGSTSLTTLGSLTQTALGNTNIISKGTLMSTSGSNMTVASGGTMKTSAAGGYDVSSTNINIAGNSTTVVGATGTFGGEGVHIYAKNVRAQKTVYAETMQATTFHGDVSGTASSALAANVAAAPGGGGASLTNVSVDGTSTALPNGALMTDYLTLSPKGILQVSIDETGDLYKMINKTEFYQGLSMDRLSTNDVRSKMHDEANHSNSAFAASCIAEGTLSPTYANPTPPGINRAASSSSSGAYLGNQDMGTSEPAWIKPAQKPTKKPFLPDARSRIGQSTSITEKTALMSGIPLSTFLRGATLNNIVDNKKRQQIARNLQVHAWYLSIINSGVIFDHNLYTLRVQRGLYSPGPAEKPTATSVNGLAMEGRSVIYELVNKGSGQVETSKTYDLAVYLKDFIPFDQLILDYDTYDPSGVLSVGIIINTPVIPETYVNIKWDNKVETRHNNKVLAGDLLEVFQQPGGAIDTRKPPVGGASANGISGVLPADGVVQARNKNPNSLPKQNIIDAVAVAVRNLGPGYQAVITPKGGIAPRASGTINHILGDAMDFQLKFNGNFVYPTDKNREIQALYRKLLIALRDNANAKGIRPGIGGYDNSADGQFIHYDEAPHRQGKLGRVGTWQFGFDTSFLA